MAKAAAAKAAKAAKLSVQKVEVWTGEIRDEVGGLDAVLAPLAEAGADLSFLVARRQPEKPGTGIVFLGGLRGAKQMAAAQKAGLVKDASLAALHVEAVNKPGLAHQVAQKLAAAQINLRGLVAFSMGKTCVMKLAFDSAADRDKAIKLLRK